MCIRDSPRRPAGAAHDDPAVADAGDGRHRPESEPGRAGPCLLYTSDAADERSSVDLGGRRIIKKKQKENVT